MRTSPALAAERHDELVEAARTRGRARGRAAWPPNGQQLLRPPQPARPAGRQHEPRHEPSAARHHSVRQPTRAYSPRGRTTRARGRRPRAAMASRPDLHAADRVDRRRRPRRRQSAARAAARSATTRPGSKRDLLGGAGADVEPGRGVERRAERRRDVERREHRCAACGWRRGRRSGTPASSAAPARAPRRGRARRPRPRVAAAQLELASARATS